MDRGGQCGLNEPMSMQIRERVLKIGMPSYHCIHQHLWHWCCFVGKIGSGGYVVIALFLTKAIEDRSFSIVWQYWQWTLLVLRSRMAQKSSLFNALLKSYDPLFVSCLEQLFAYMIHYYSSFWQCSWFPNQFVGECNPLLFLALRYINSAIAKMVTV